MVAVAVKCSRHIIESCVFKMHLTNCINWSAQLSPLKTVCNLWLMVVQTFIARFTTMAMISCISMNSVKMHYLFVIVVAGSYSCQLIRLLNRQFKSTCLTVTWQGVAIAWPMPYAHRDNPLTTRHQRKPCFSHQQLRVTFSDEVAK